MSAWHLAQYNVALALGPADSPAMADFYSAVPAINAIAESRPGFVWRLKDDPPPTPGVYRLANLSVWESIDALREFTYRSAHTGIFRDRGRWFQPNSGKVVLWWIPAGHQPGYDEAESRLAHLAANGPSQHAFTFAASFPQPAAPSDAASSSGVSSNSTA